MPIEVSCEMLEHLDFKYFANSPNILNESFAEYLQPYYDQYIKNGNKPFYHCSLAYNTILDDKKFRFLIVATHNTKVFVPYKVIQLLKTRQIRFLTIPSKRHL